MSKCIIDSIQVSTLQVPLATPYHLSYGTLEHTSTVIVKVTTEDGIIGFGEADPMVPFTSETTETITQVIVNVLSKIVLGKSALNVSVLYKMMSDSMPGNTMARGALDMALWDICGKHYGVPVSVLLGGAFTTQIPLLWPMGVQSKDDDKHVLMEKMSQGFNTFMLKMGAEKGDNSAAKLQTQIERVQSFVKEMHYNHPHDLHVVCDANQGWDVSQARQFISACNDVTKDIAVNLTIEQPLPATMGWDNSNIRSMSINKISADESVMTIEDAARLCSQHEVDVLSIKVSKNGGISGSKAISSLAQAHGVSVLCNSMIELGVSQAALLQIAVTMPNLLGNGHGHCFMSTLRLKGDVTNFNTFIQDGIVTIPGTPGLGIEINEEKMNEFKVSQTTVDRSK